MDLVEDERKRLDLYKRPDETQEEFIKRCIELAKNNKIGKKIAQNYERHTKPPLF